MPAVVDKVRRPSREQAAPARPARSSLPSCWSRCSGRATRRSARPPTARIFGFELPARDRRPSMPHVWDMLGRFGDPERRGADRTVGVAVLEGAWYTFRMAMVGFVLGVGRRPRPGRRHAAVPPRRAGPAARTSCSSQTVPLVALAPLVVGWGGNLSLFGPDWEPWMSVAVIAAYLAFFPVAVGALRGPAVALARVGRADGLLRRVVEPDAGQAAVPGGGAVPRAGAEAGRRGVGRRRRRGRDLDRHPRRHRPPHHRVLPRGHLATRPRCTRRSSAPPCSAWPWPG